MQTKAEISTSMVTDKRRFKAWGLLCLLAAIALAAYETVSHENYWGAAFCVFCSSITIIIAAFGAIFHIVDNKVTHMVVGTFLEGIVSLIVLGLWATALYVVLDPSSGLAQMYVGRPGSLYADYQTTVSNANLYFASWGAGICAFNISIDVAISIREKRNSGGSIPASTISKTHGMGSFIKEWFFLMIASAVSLGASITFKNQVCSIQGGTEDMTCTKNNYGFITGKTFSSFELL
jgi:hypothetical protein